MPVFDADKWFEEVKAKLAGVLPEEDIERARLEVKRGFLRQDDYDRTMNKRKDEYAAKEAALLETEREQQSWWSKNQDRITKLHAFEQEYGDLDKVKSVLGRPNMVKTESGDVITRDEYERMLNERTEAIQKQARDEVYRATQSTLALQKFMSKRIQSHTREFNEPLDVDALENYAAQQAAAGKQYPTYDAVYDEWVADKRKAAAEQERENWKKQTRAEIERDLRSSASVPYDPTRSAPSSPFYQTRAAAAASATPAPGAASDADARNSFIQTFQDDTTK